MTDVAALVVGAGFAGLAAARQLHKSGIEDIIILEANNRVGGRTKHGELAGLDIDLGGMWVGPTQTRLTDLAGHYGIGSYPTPIEGKTIYNLNGREYRGDREDIEGRFSTRDKFEYLYLTLKLNKLLKAHDVERPWAHPRAAELDNQTFEHWLRRTIRSETLLKLFRLTSLSLFCAETSQISMLFVVHYLKSGDGFDVLVSADSGGAQNFLFHGGVHQIARAMADELGPRLHLGESVREIAWTDDSVHVRSSSGAYTARRAVVAIPITMVPSIQFDPSLPQQRQRLSQRLAMGSAIKYWIAYDRPFWRDQGLNGIIIHDGLPCSPCFDATPPNADVGAIAGFFDADHAINYGNLTAQDRQAEVVEMLTEHFGAEAAEPLGYVDNDWTEEEWANGCYGAFAPPGVYHTFSRWIREPVGAIHWAGTETSPTWTGYIEGAIRSGESAANDIVADLAVS